MVLLILLVAGLVSAKCFEPTIAHPPPIYDPHDALLQEAFGSIDAALTVAVAAPEFASTSFSVEVTSSKETLWSQHHTARERNASRPDIPHVNGDALYRIASITKTFTVLGLLYQHAAGNLSLDDTVNKYLPELGDKSDGGTPWKDITLRSLASQLSGLPRDWAQSDIINAHIDPTEFGLPPNVSREGLPECDEWSPNYETPCTAQDLYKIVQTYRPLFAPNQLSTYSNIAYELLGLVLSRVTNRTYEAYIHDAIFTPLNMTHSTLSIPPDTTGVIPLNPQFWDVDEGVQNPTGGIYSSSSDMSKYLRYILTHYNALTPALNWLHPHSASRGTNSFYGMPWEILHTDRVLLDSRRSVRFVTKSGGLPGYTSIVILAPEYDIGITILVAGPPSSLFSTIREIVSVQLIRAAELVAMSQLDRRYAGTYRALDDDARLNSSMVIRADRRGLVVTQLISNSSGVFEALASKGLVPERWYAQISPTLLFRNEREKAGEEWRLLIVEERAEGVGAVWDEFCAEDYDGLDAYAGVPLGEVVFWGDGVVELSAFRVNLTRVEDGNGFADGEQERMEL
ncbi:beta-lactamase/transpeptidase-like protein [Decorospora gaudefroyi]|uniref:Beta-lactamase/transpeptidase-like protein n=1 Tax=Decorospora gaudefroyi TaxID=184978 RepID=A0A6A5KHM4_9PLEO|nr:beta-lactamase/transpeptidase-like protein [Decorospora gaudefroyi]